MRTQIATFRQMMPSTKEWDLEVLPILSDHCFKCHGQDGPQAGLHLRTAVSKEAGTDRSS